MSRCVTSSSTTMMCGRSSILQDLSDVHQPQPLRYLPEPIGVKRAGPPRGTPAGAYTAAIKSDARVELADINAVSALPAGCAMTAALFMALKARHMPPARPLFTDGMKLSPNPRSNVHNNALPTGS